MKLILEPGKSKNIIATIAIGSEYLDSWEQYALPNWKEYCIRNELGLLVINEDLISRNNKFWKKPTWQKLLIGDALNKSNLIIENVCYLDTDILINPNAPNIFDSYNSENFGLVSLRNNLPFPYEEVIRRIAFLRHNYYDNNYPLDSALHINLNDLYKYHMLPVQPDEACMGLIIFNISNHADIMKSWFYKYDANVQSITNGGDQTHLNFEIQNYNKMSWLDYRFQSIWVFEMAWKYPFLYSTEYSKSDLIKECIEASLHANFFLHFAGAWHESIMWKLGTIFEKENSRKLLDDYFLYSKRELKGNPIGMVRPMKNSSK